MTTAIQKAIDALRWERDRCGRLDAKLAEALDQLEKLTPLSEEEVTNLCLSGPTKECPTCGTDTMWFEWVKGFMAAERRLIDNIADQIIEQLEGKEICNRSKS